MNKKDFCIAILEKLLTTRPPAEDLLILLQEDYFDTSKIDTLTDILKAAISEVKDENLKSKLQKVLDYLENLKQRELADREKEKAELDELLKTIQSL